MDQALFREPAVEYRPVIFWSWNGKLEIERLLRQLRQMKEAGIGGVFMHARDGLATPYMQDEWFQCVKACIDEAERLGMKAWAYDENGWPSGFAGGEVPRLGEAYRAKAIVLKRAPVEGDPAYRLLHAEATETSGTSGASETQGGSKASEAQEACYVYEWTMPLGHARFHDASYVDLLNPDVTEAFLNVTYEAYKERIGAWFGGTVPGMFSDEACALMWLQFDVPALPWTTGMPDLFRERFGYDLIAALPALFLDRPESRAVRYDYWLFVVERMVSAFSERIYDWCEENGLQYTGHYMAEDRIGYIMEWLGDAMPHYEYMHIPGMDHLGKRIHLSDPAEGESNATVITARQVTSVANQLGKKRALSELFACGGQAFDLRHQKRMVDWHLVHGINFFTPHLLPYSLTGIGKRDYPPTIGPQQPWWQHAELLNGYMARASYALTQGERVTGVLVIHPIESAWETYTPVRRKANDELNETLERVCLSLLDRHINFDFGNEHYIAKYGQASNGEFRIGDGRYTKLVLPLVYRLRSSTLALLRAFAESGGRIYTVEPRERLLARMPAFEAIPTIAFGEGDDCRPDDAIISIGGEGKERVWLHERKERGNPILFLAHLDLERTTTVRVELNGRYDCYRWDAESGEREAFAVKHGENGGTEFEWTFQGPQSLLIEARPAFAGSAAAGAEAEADALAKVESLGTVKAGAEASAVVQEDSGSAVLVGQAGQGGYAELRGSAASKRTVPLRIIEASGFNAAVLDYFTAEEGIRTASLLLHESWKGQTLYLAAERRTHDEARWNGHVLAPSAVEWMDPDMIVYAVPREWQRGGANQFALMGGDGGFPREEPVYVLGDFRVAIVANELLVYQTSSDSFTNGQFAEEGFPFYSGSLTLGGEVAVTAAECEASEGGWWIELQDPAISVAELSVNGSICGARAWGPWRWDVTSLIQPGVNRIALTVCNTLRNVFGPHHLPGDLAINFLGPEHFAQAEPGAPWVVNPYGIGDVVLVRGE